jgi:hypothetical protein
MAKAFPVRPGNAFSFYAVLSGDSTENDPVNPPSQAYPCRHEKGDEIRVVPVANQTSNNGTQYCLVFTNKVASSLYMSSSILI